MMVSGTVSRGLVCASVLVVVLSMTSLSAQCVPAPFGTGSFWVSSHYTDEVFAFDELGSFLESFSHPDLDGPRSVTLSPTGDIYVASQSNDRIIVLDAAGGYLRQFTDGSLDGPTGGTIGPDGDYFVCSFGTDTVLRFDANEVLIDTFASPGLNGPNCIYFYPDGSFGVTGQISNDVHLFTADGTPLDSFATGQSSVMGAALDFEGRLLVAGGSSSDVRVFGCSGGVLETWSVPGGPQSIAIREDGRIFVTTFFTDEVLQLTANGEIISSWTGGNAIRGIEFFPGPLPTFTRGDSNGDGGVDVSDAIGVLAYLFAGGEFLLCPDAADINDSGGLDISDPVALLAYLFQSASPPAEPFLNPGPDPTDDALNCLSL